MALVPLNIAPALRPWRFAGVTHLLLNEAALQRLDALRAAPLSAPDLSRSAQVPPAGRGTVAAPSRLVEKKIAPIQESHPERPGIPSVAPENFPESQPPSQSPESSPASQPPEKTPEQWTPYWKDLLTRTPSRPALLWTYPSLSRDLGGEADESHRNFLRRLLGDMSLPRGSHAFWPLNSFPYVDGESEKSVDVSMFLSGVSLLNPGTVILMTGVAPPELGIDARLLSPLFVRGKRYVVTPHVDDLLLVPRRYAQLMVFLKALLR